MSNLIFIVEDNVVQQKLMKVHFEEILGNYTVRAFENPHDIFSQLNENPLAVILDHFFDDRMGKTGLHFLRVIKVRHPSIAVIYYTSWEDENLRNNVMGLGAEQYIVKNSASLVRLRSALDLLHERKARKRSGVFRRIFS